MTEPVGIRELRHNAADIINAAEAGKEFHVTVRGKDTGVVITKYRSAAPTERRRGISVEQAKQLYARPKSPGYQEAMLDMVERGRDAAGRVGDR